MRTVTLYRIYTNIEELVVDYESGNLDSADVKQAFFELWANRSPKLKTELLMWASKLLAM
jgi:hypothetical protein